MPVRERRRNAPPKRMQKPAGDKPIRRVKRKDASLRALKSIGKPGKSHSLAVRRTVGKGIRKYRISKGKNPNTGKGSFERLALRRARKTGLITRTQKRKAIKTLKNLPASTRKSYSTGPQARGKSVRATGKALSDVTRRIRRQRKSRGLGKFKGTSAARKR